jgi:hypothetical protein
MLFLIANVMENALHNVRTWANRPTEALADRIYEQTVVKLIDKR